MRTPCRALSRWLVCILCVLLLPTAGAQAQQPPVQEPQPRRARPPLVDLHTPPADGAAVQSAPPQQAPPAPEQAPRRDHGGYGWVPWAVAGGLGTAWVAAQLHRDQTYADDASLAAQGPRFADSYAVGSFAIQGYVKGDWPMVVDFLPQPDTCTMLEISLDGKLAYTRLLDADGVKGRRLLQITLPKQLGERTRPALFMVRSERPACASQGQAPGIAAPLEIYGIGCGPRAIGSVAIDQLRFEPGEPKLPQERVRLAYRARYGFNHASVEILRYNENPPGTINVQRVRARRMDALLPGSVITDTWDGLDERGQRSVGVHRLQVRAWFTVDDRSWVGAISPSSVRVAR
jgi:hypothetical protein